MNSVAIVESPAESRDLFYIVTLMSNVLRRNSAVDHQTFATRTHRLIKSYHAGRSTKKPAAAPQKNTSAASTMSTEETAPQKPKVETDQQGHTVHYY